jgi:hypothetical protein
MISPPLTLIILSHILWMMSTSHYDIPSSHLDDIITYTMDDEYYPLWCTLLSPWWYYHIYYGWWVLFNMITPPLTLMMLLHILWMMGTIHYDVPSSHLDVISYTMDDEYYPL